MNNTNNSRTKINMEPGHISSIGFKGKDKRSISEIIEQDKKIVERYNLTCSEIASALSLLKKKGEKGMGISINVDNIYEVTVDENRGFISCPFDTSNRFRKINILVKKLTTKETILFSDLSLHLIDKHCFFQGKGATFRLEPEKLVTFLEDFFSNEKKSKN